MNQAELIKQIAEVSGQSRKDVEHTLKTIGDVAQAELQQGGEVTLPGLGKLTAETRAARKGRNPATGAEIDIPAKRVPHFAAAKALKDAVNS
ncbi:MAG: HU family DNA-binding protein [Gallionella sp.]|nr:HU family DNA-binding protein [Gallionella sp.]MDD4947196.1 HU family DNA-binding protein [Gallionella sp.]